jgi:hypothetical protein
LDSAFSFKLKIIFSADQTRALSVRLLGLVQLPSLLGEQRLGHCSLATLIRRLGQQKESRYI